ncbi:MULTISPECIES: BPSL0761 family protein [unclassified Paraburkholderia]|uniref:BPSL0761 family protein n=1 Tax=unclassified Paraburkholderia TaxID=2615204 RepID=UPI00288BE87E|nr:MULTISPECIES: BPSL0761 family protein [unclassified Paraburkholderia]
MTMPDERTRGVFGARELLFTLAQGPGAYSADPVRTLAKALLRHYPLEVDVAVSALALPNVWASASNWRRDSLQPRRDRRKI